MKTVIYLGKVLVSSVHSNASLLYGENQTRGWQTRSKGNSAIGRVNGDRNIIASRLNLLNDPDILDTFIKVRG